MEIIDQLSLALGFATLAGLNLYLTVLLTGLAIRFDLIHLFDRYADLAVLSETPVLAVATTLFLIEFFADKIPWVDSLWDTIHTLIRPVGGGLLAIGAIGAVDPSLNVMIGLLAGGTTLVAHGAKAGTRAVVNLSPEPVSNIVVSVSEDVAVTMGSVLMWTAPMAFAVLCVLFLAAVLFFAPRIIRRLRRKKTDATIYLNAEHAEEK